MVSAAARAFEVPPRARGDASGATRRLTPRRGGRREVPNRGRVGGRPADATAWRPVTLGDVDELGVARSPESDTGELSTRVTFESPRALMERFALVLERTPLESDVPPRDAIVMRHALSRHPDARRKVGGGVSRIRVRAHDTKGYRYFELTRVDGTTDDVSFRKCVAALFPGFGSGAYREGAGAGGLKNAERRKSSRGTVGVARGAALLTSLILEQTSVRGVLRVLRLEGDDEVLAALRGEHFEVSAFPAEDARSKKEDARSEKEKASELRASLDRVHVAAALVKISKLMTSGDADGAEGGNEEPHEEPRSFRGAEKNALASSETYAALVATAKAMCADGRFDARATANAIHAVAKTFASSPSSRGGDPSFNPSRLGGSFDAHNGSFDAQSAAAFSARDALPANAYGLMAALEARVADVAEDMSPQAVANALWGFATARWELGEESWRALQAQVVRRGGGETHAAFERTGDVSDRAPRSTFNAQETANVAWALAKLGWCPTDETWFGLNASVARTARDMDARAVALTLWAYATLGEKPGEAALAALEAAARRACGGARADERRGQEKEGRVSTTKRERCSLGARDVSNIWWAFVTLELAPRDATRRALERASARVLTESPDVTPADVANQSWALAALEHLESDPERAREGVFHERGSKTESRATAEWCRALETAEVRLASDENARARSRMSPSDVAGAMLNVAANSARRVRLRRREASAEEAWRALESAAVRFCRDALRERDGKNLSDDPVSPRDLANVWYAFASAGRLPAASTRTALELASAAAAPRFSARHVAAATYAYATIGFPGTESASAAAFLRAMDATAARVAGSDEMNARTLAQTLWGFGAVAALSRGGVEPGFPASSAALWSASHALATERFQLLDVTLCTFFHAKLMYEELVRDGAAVIQKNAGDATTGSSVSFPSWIDGAAREAWIANAVGDVDVSGTHFEVSECLKAILPGEEVVLECLTADECFSLDVYVPQLDLGVEVDGPTHYAELETGEGTRRRVAKTRLRDAFLRRRMRTLVVVPWFEFRAARGEEEKKAYLRAKLRDAGVEA